MTSPPRHGREPGARPCTIDEHMNGINRATGSVMRAGIPAVLWAIAVAATGQAAWPARVDASGPEGPEGPAYALTAWSAETGASPGDVFAITQDLDGYLWLGTPAGLVRFDGFRFVPWANAAGTPVPGPVLALAGARDGSVWVGAASAIFRVSGTTVRQYTTEDGFQGGVTALIEDRRGTIWAGNRRGLFHFAGGRWTPMGAADGLPAAEVFSLHEDQSGRLWVSTTNGVYQGHGDGFELVDAASTNVQSFAEDDSGGIWVTDSSAIVRRLGSSVRASYAPDIRLPANAWRLLHDRRGQIWVAALGGGLLHVDRANEAGAVVRRFDYERRMTGSTRSLYEDREGNIWVGLRGGLLRLSETVFRTDLPLDGLTQDGVRTLAVSGDGSVWVATGHSVNRFSTDGKRVAYALPQTLALHADQHDKMWAATGNGLWRLSGGKFERVPVPGPINWGRVMGLTTDASDTLWLCSALNGVMTWNGEAVSAFTGQSDLTSRSCSTIYRDRRGRVWVGFSGGGAAVHERGVFQAIGERDGLTRGTLVGITEDRAGAIWLATASGLNRYQNGRVTAITPLNAPLTEVVPSVVEDDEGFIWVGIRAGASLLRFHPRELDKLTANPTALLDYATYDGSDGLPQASLSWQNGLTGARGGDGRIWFAAGVGVTTLDPRTRPRPRRAQPPQVEAVVADGRRQASARGASLPYGTSTVRFEYGTVSLAAASKVRFRYMLEGLHDDWVSAGSTREAVFDDLPPGDYRFRVGSTYEGLWVEAPTWDFAVAPPFYLTRWFLMLLAVMTASIVAAAWWMRLRAVRNQYALVFMERARLSREIHDTLLQGLAAIGVELETIATQLDPAQGSARDGLRRLRRQVGHSLREARESILDLRRNPMKPRDLVQSLSDLAENTARNGVPTDFTTDGRVERSSDEVDVQLFRIAQEAVGNARKHGQATHIRMELRADPTRIVLTVEDNGRGFVTEAHDPAPSLGQHLGLLSMRERAERVRGRLNIISAPGRGTTIEASVPVPSE